MSMALFEFQDNNGDKFRMHLTLSKATQLADEKKLRFEMIHGGTSGHGTPGEDF